MTRPLLLALLSVAPLLAGPFSAEIGERYYNSDRYNWYRDVTFHGPNGTEVYSIIGLDEITSTVLGDIGVLVMSGEATFDGALQVLTYGQGGCSPCDPSIVGRLPYRWGEIDYPAGFRDIPGYEPLLTGWDGAGYLKGILYMEPIGSIGAYDLETMRYTWDLKVHTHNPEPATWALLGGGLAAIIWRRRLLNLRRQTPNQLN